MDYTIHQRDNGNYYTRIYYRDQDGRVKRKKFSAVSKTELRRIIANYFADRSTYNTESFRVAMEEYIHVKKSVISPSTLRTYLGYQKALNTDHSAFTAKYIDRVRTPDLQKLVNELISSGLSPKTVHDYMGFVQAVLKYNGFTVQQAHLPEIHTPDPAIPDSNDIKQMLIDVKGSSIEFPFRLALYGLRRGEICALNPSEDLNGTTLHVHHSMAYMPLAKGKKERRKVIKAPKTPQSDRYIQIDDDLAQKLNGLESVTDYAPDRLTKKMSQFLKKYNPDFHMHTLRHFFASYLHEQGVPDADILAAGGWKTDNVMKNVYRQSLNSSRASSTISGLLEGVASFDDGGRKRGPKITENSVG